jgi:hypothetical protein
MPDGAVRQPPPVGDRSRASMLLVPTRAAVPPRARPEGASYHFGPKPRGLPPRTLCPPPPLRPLCLFAPPRHRVRSGDPARPTRASLSSPARGRELSPSGCRSPSPWVAGTPSRTSRRRSIPRARAGSTVLGHLRNPIWRNGWRTAGDRRPRTLSLIAPNRRSTCREAERGPGPRGSNRRRRPTSLSGRREPLAVDPKSAASRTGGPSRSTSRRSRRCPPAPQSRQ